MNSSRVENYPITLKLLKHWAVCSFVSFYTVCFADDVEQSAGEIVSQISIIEVGVDLDDVPRVIQNGRKSAEAGDVESNVSKSKQSNEPGDRKADAMAKPTGKSGGRITIIEVGVDLGDLPAVIKTGEILDEKAAEKTPTVVKVEPVVPKVKQSKVQVAEKVVPTAKSSIGKKSPKSMVSKGAVVDDVLAAIEAGEFGDEELAAKTGQVVSKSKKPDLSVVKEAGSVVELSSLVLASTGGAGAGSGAETSTGRNPWWAGAKGLPKENIGGGSTISKSVSNTKEVPLATLSSGSKSPFRRGMGIGDSVSLSESNRDGQGSSSSPSLPETDDLSQNGMEHREMSGPSELSPDLLVDTREGEFVPTQEPAHSSSDFGSRIDSREWQDSLAGLDSNTGQYPSVEAYPVNHGYSGYIDGLDSYGQPDGNDYDARNESYSFDATWPLFTRDYDTDQAEAKLGPLYLDLQYAEAGAYSYNFKDINGSDDGWGSWIGVRGRGLMRITPSLFLSFQGGVFYLPNENRFGFFFNNSGVPILQFRYQGEWGEWDVELYDRFGVYYPQFFASSGNADVQQRYSFGFGNYSRPTGFYGDPYFWNMIGGRGSRQISKDWRLSLAADHTNYWRTQGVGEDFTREHVGARLDSNGSDIPFSPYLAYDTYSYDQFASLINRFYVGGSGRLTENLRLDARTGYLWTNNFNSEYSSWLWRIGLHHDISEVTNHGVRFGQYFYTLDFTADSVVSDYVRYYLNHQFSDRLSAMGYVQWSSDQYLSGTLANNEFEREIYGGWLTYRATDRTTFRLGAYHQSTNNLATAGNGREDLRYYQASMFTRISDRSTFYWRYWVTDSDRYRSEIFMAGLRRSF